MVVRNSLRPFFVGSTLMNSTVVLVGGSGMLGTVITEKLVAKGYQVVVVSRTAKSVPFAKSVTYSELAAVVRNARAVINLAGANVGKHRWTPLFMQEIVESRVSATKKVVDAIAASEYKPILINASGVGYYGNTLVPSSEATGRGWDFLSEVTNVWENSARKAEEYTRVVIFRIATVLDSKDGALAQMLPLLQLGLGGVLGKGTQGFAWVHISDVANAMVWAIETSHAKGTYNLAAPEQLTMSQFVRAVARQLHRPACFRVPATILYLVLGKRAEIVCNGQIVKPVRLQGTNYRFEFPDIASALKNLLEKGS